MGDIRQEFSIAPAGPGSLYFGIGFVVFMVAVSALVIWATTGHLRVKYQVGPNEFRIVGDLYGRRIPWSDINGGSIREVDLTSHPELRPQLRLNGTGMPGYAAGWFRLRGGARALAFLTDQHRVVVAETSRGYVLLLSTPDPEALVTAMKSAADSGGNPSSRRGSSGRRA